MTQGNAKCPCGSGLKYKKCCRNKGRDPETCHFCGRKEPEVSGEYAVLVDRDGKEQQERIFACKGCIEKQRLGGDTSGLAELLVMAAGLSGFRLPRKPRGKPR